MVEEPLKIGDPWSILPIKNAKYARDLIEVHLSDRELDLLEKFEDFPNLEVVWLNNNHVFPFNFSLITLLMHIAEEP
jgi:hypothetical protein